MQEKIQNIHQKFNAPQNEIRLAIMNFIVDNQTSRPVGPFFKGEADGGEESDCKASQ